MMLQEKIKNLVQPIIEDLGYVLWGCDFLSQGKQGLLRIYIDGNNGIGIEDCELVSRHVSALLDVEDPLPGYYRLEISSPGIPRPLFYSWQYTKYIGECIQIKLAKPLAEKKKYQGRIVKVDNDVLTLQTNEGQQEFFISHITKAYLTV